MTWNVKKTQRAAEFGDGLFRKCLLAGLGLALLGQPTWIQAAVTGTISGFVRDPTGAVMPGVSVTAKMVEQQIMRTVQTNSEGYYTLVGHASWNLRNHL